jgi:hypothetical protein
VPGSGHRWGPADPSSGPGRGDDWPAGTAERDPAAAPGTISQRSTTSDQASAEHASAERTNSERINSERASTEQPGTERANTADRGRITLTGRGAIAGMLLLFLVSLLMASWLQWGVLAGASFVIGSVAPVWWLAVFPPPPPPPPGTCWRSR